MNPAERQIFDSAPLEHLDSFYIGGQWVPATSGKSIDVIDSTNEEVYYSCADASAQDMDRAISAARDAFDHGPWPRMTHQERADHLHRLADALRKRMPRMAEIWPRETGIVFDMAYEDLIRQPNVIDRYADMADTFPWQERYDTTWGGEYGLLVQEPVGVVAAIITWNGPMALIAYKCSPALIAGCTVIIKMPPESPASAYLFAEAVEEAGLPAGVVNFVTAADTEVSKMLVADPRVDKITFTGSSEVGRQIAGVASQRFARYTLELGGKSAAVLFDDADIEQAALNLTGAQCYLTGQVCAALTRIIVPRQKHDRMVKLMVDAFSRLRVGDPFDPESQIGALSTERHLQRVLGYVETGKKEGAVLATGGGRPAHLEKGFYVEPTIFANVDNSSVIAQEEIFGPVLCVIPSDSEDHAIELANQSRYGLNAAIFTKDVDVARKAATRLRSGTVGHNAFRADFGIAFGGVKDSGVGREGGIEGLRAFLETKTLVLDGIPSDGPR